MAPGNGTELAESIRRLHAVVQSARSALDRDVYEVLKGLFMACVARPALLDELHRLAPQYGKPEFLLPVDASGAPLGPNEALLQDFRLLAAGYPEFALWLRGADAQADGQAGALLAARWLCVLSGLRHRTVELFIDHPQARGYTLVQVRSPAKLEYPGCFDLPCAGHVVGLASVEEGLLEELSEELGLREADLVGLRRLGAYEHAESRKDGATLDVEYRTLFRARLQPGALERIRFADGEVAAIAVFAFDDLQAVVRGAPERIASGLSASLAWYLAG
jgi:isopentenyldiphosphate isomerase